MSKIMKRRCKDCIAPVGFAPDPMCLDFKQLIDIGEMKAEDAAWSCFNTCTKERIANDDTRVCKGCAEYFGITEQQL